MQDDDLEARVDQLEATVEQQQERIAALQPDGVSRRGVIGGAGLLAGGGLAALLSGSASAQSAPTASSDSEQSGSMGATGDSNDVWVDQLYDSGGNVAANIDPGEAWNFTMRDVVFGDSYHDSVSTVFADIGDGSTVPRLSNIRGGTSPELSVQPNGGDNVGSALLYPSGTSTRAHWMVANASDPNNFGAIKLELDGATGRMEAFTKGTGGTLPDTFVFRDFSEGVEISHPGDQLNALQVGNNNDVFSDTGIYLRTVGLGQIRVGGNGRLGLYSESQENGVTIEASGIATNHNGAKYEQRSDPSTGQLADGECMTYCSDGSGTGAAGDLVYAVNDGGTIKTSVIAQRSNAT